MKRRSFVLGGLALSLGTRLVAAMEQNRLEDAADALAGAVATGQVAAAAIHVVTPSQTLSRAFGAAKTPDAMFLLGSISKPIAMTALMTLYDRGEFQLDDPLQKFLPAFKGDGRERVTLRHVLTHVAGLPDQLPENNDLRKRHATLAEFADHAQRTPLSFAPGERYQYSSMGILLAARVAERISGAGILHLVESAVLRPLKMEHSAQGLGRFKLDDMVAVQTDRAAPESGGGDPTAKAWDWNSSYWRKLGAPWGGTHASAPDIARFLDEFLHERGAAVKPATARLMVANHNARGQTPRGLGFSVGAGSAGCSEKTFGHTGSTGTLCWADPAHRAICVVLTSLPARAVQPHPRDIAAAKASAAIGKP